MALQENGMMFFNADTIKEALKVVIDPELGVNIVDLGLVYEVSTEEDGTVNVLMTLTTPACPIGPMLEEQIADALRDLPGLKEVKTTFTFDPPWTQEMVTEDGRIELGMW